MSERAQRIWLIVGVTAHTLAFHVVYVTFIAPRFGYNGSVFEPVGDWTVPMVLVLAILPSAWLPTRIHRPSQVAVWLLFLLGYVPASMIPYYVLGESPDTLFPLSMALIGSMAILALGDRIPRTYWIPPIRLTPRAYALSAAVACAMGVAYVAATIGITLDLPELLEVYDTRATYGDAVDARGRLLAYAVVWSVNVAAPISIAIGLRQRRYWLAIVGVAVQMLMYGVTGFKSALFSAVLVTGLVVLLSLSMRAKPALLAFGSAALIAGIATFDHVTGGLVATSIFVRRLLEVPGLVTARYFDYFSDHSAYRLGHTFLGYWFQPPSAMTPPEVIGATYFGPSTYANGGVWADATANFGLIGILAFSVALATIFWFLDVVADKADLATTGAVTGIFAVTLTNTSLFTTLLSHGFGPALVAFALMPRGPGRERRGVRRSGQPMAEPRLGAIRASSSVSPQAQAVRSETRLTPPV